MPRSLTTRLLALAVGLAMGCTGEPANSDVASRREALGEPMDGFPSWEERVVFVWTNRARCDPAADLASCTVCAERDCYTPVPPLVWSHQLSRASRFHSDNLVRGGCGLQHNSPCTVVNDIDTRYTPGSCNGDPSCACTGGSYTCGSSGTGFSARIGLFGVGASAENIATGSQPVSMFYRWLHEADTNPACGWRIANGHRANILGGSRALGVGKSLAGNVWTQNFNRSGSPDGLVGGVHTPETGSSIEFRANWYRASGPTMALVNVDGTCTSMSLERGSTTNGTYYATVGSISGCTRYYFQFEEGGSTVTYPTTGSFGIGCPEDWVATRAGLCGCTPSCGASVCGDDGCGGSTCGVCSADQTCSGGACVCGGAGPCECAPGRTDCGAGCVDTMLDPGHCGGCDQPCAADEGCSGGVCMRGVPRVDAGTDGGFDAGARIDAGPDFDGGPSFDGGSSGDGVIAGACGCRVASSESPPVWFSLPLFVLASRLRRRRNRQP